MPFIFTCRAFNFRLCTLKKCSSFWGTLSPGPLLGLCPWTPLLKYSQQTMNQDNKISSVRLGTINIELGLDLYVLLYYRGLRSVDDIYRLQSAHSENNREPGVHCNKNDTNSNKLCLSFSQGLKIQVVYFFKCSMLQLLGDSVPQIPCRGFAPGPHWGPPSPRPPDLPPPNSTF